MAGEAEFLAFKPAGDKVPPAQKLSHNHTITLLDQVQQLVQNCAQVKVLVFHPVHPWLAYADGSHTVTIWDWSSQQASVCLSRPAPPLRSSGIGLG